MDVHVFSDISMYVHVFPTSLLHFMHVFLIYMFFVFLGIVSRVSIFSDILINCN